MIGDHESNNGNIGIDMIFDSSTSTINAQWIGDSFQYVILRLVDG